MREIQDIWYEYRNALHRYILKKVSDSHTADDLLQEVFIKLQKSPEKLKSVNNLQAWLYTVTRNSISDYYRTKKRYSEVPEFTTYPESDELELRELASCIIPLIENLPDIYREAITLSDINGLTQKQLAQKLGISYSGAKSRVQRGRTMLKNMIFECCKIELNNSGTLVNYQKINQECC